MHTDKARHLQFPCLAGQNIDSIGSSDTDSHHSEASGIRSMGVCSDHHSTWESIILEHDLMYDARSRPPETNMIFLRYRIKEIIHLFVSLSRNRQILLYTNVGTYQVVAMHRCRHSHLILSGVHELQQRHLSSGILHGNTVRTEVYIIFTPFERFYIRCIVKMRIQYFFCISKWSIQYLTSVVYVL